jgi:hypothetical protein
MGIQEREKGKGKRERLEHGTQGTPVKYAGRIGMPLPNAREK